MAEQLMVMEKQVESLEKENIEVKKMIIEKERRFEEEINSKMAVERSKLEADYKQRHEAKRKQRKDLKRN